MSNAVASVELGNPIIVATLGTIGVSLVNSAGTIVTGQDISDNGSTTAQSVTFNNVAPGTYTVTAERKLASGAAAATAVSSAPFTVAPPPGVSVTVPLSVTVTVS